MKDQHTTGLRGEDIAARHLTALGYQLLETRYRGADGEVDLVMRDGAYTVFIEVKYRPGGRAGTGFMAVTPDKQRRLYHAAMRYLSEREQIAAPVRFDVVEITADGIRHIPNAFQPGFW